MIALASKAAPASDGESDNVPSGQGVLVVTGDHIVFLKKKLVGVGAGDKLIEWPRSSIEFTYEDNGAWKYAGLLLQFNDGSQCMVYGEKRWGLAGIAAAR